MSLTAAIEASARRMFPAMSPEQAITELLLERAQKNLIKYQAISHQFQAKYSLDFESFRKQILSTYSSSEREQDYFDWELAITGISDMETEIKHLKNASYPRSR